ncbi:MAG: formylglycine-generating enzyme family protein [Acidobacteria bacterium]|nr:formylglycine-generating enzyme family protein [Acidobacteriota bacterium]
MTDGKKGCCTPSANREGTQQDRNEQQLDPLHKISAAGMVSLPGGRFLMGTDYPFGFPDDGEGPVRSVNLSPFSIDIAPVTNDQFSKFIQSTKYVTEAERYNWSFVFWAHIPKARYSQLVADTVEQAPWWCKVYGAKWNSPEGPGSHIDNRLDHPVVHVSHADAAAYAAWTGKHLPTEAEWEYAARGGLQQKLFPWGDELQPNGKHLCNIWQGQFPSEDTAEDGYAGTCPVLAFPPNGYGLYSMTGNVWEWTQDWFGTAHPKHETVNPRGPKHGTEKAMKGGSFLCHASYCNRYRVAARTKNTPDSSTSNIGFRCVRRG